MLEKNAQVAPASTTNSKGEISSPVSLGEAPTKMSRSISAFMKSKPKEDTGNTLPRQENTSVNSNDAPKKIGSKGRPMSVQVLGTVNKGTSKQSAGSTDELTETPSLLSRMGRKQSDKTSTGFVFSC
jgi:hypothetical protein